MASAHGACTCEPYGEWTHDAPVAELVAEPLDQRSSGPSASCWSPRAARRGTRPGCRRPSRPGRRRCSAAVAWSAGQRGQLAGERADRCAELGGPAELVALPERQPPGLAGRGGDQHPVVGDVLDPPRRRARARTRRRPGTRRPSPRRARRPGSAFSPTRNTPNRPRSGIVPPLVTASRWAHRVGPSGCRQPGPTRRAAAARGTRRTGSGRSAGRAWRRTPSGAASRTGAERRTRANRSSTSHSSTAVAATTCWASTSSGLRRHVQRLDGTGAHALHGDGGLHEVAAVLGQQHPARDLADLVPGASDPLEGGGHRRRRLDLHDQVDRTHVDAELEARRRDHAGQPAALEVVLDQRPLLLGHRAVVGPGDHHLARTAPRCRSRPSAGDGTGRSAPIADAGAAGRAAHGRLGALGRDLVEPGGQPLGEPSGVGEHDRRAVLLDQVDDPLLDVRPDRPAALGGTGRGPLGYVVGRGQGELGHVLDGDDDREVPLLGRRPAPPPPPAASRQRNRATSSTGRTVADRPIRWAGGPADGAARRAARGTGRGARRAWCRRRRAPRRRSPSRPRAATRGPGEVSMRNSDSGVVIRMSGGVVAAGAGRRRWCPRSAGRR